jgi:hypothetical protein
VEKYEVGIIRHLVADDYALCKLCQQPIRPGDELLGYRVNPELRWLAHINCVLQPASVS